jgi:hypothetical protein
MFKITPYCSIQFTPLECKSWDNTVESLVAEDISEDHFTDLKKKINDEDKIDWIKQNAKPYFENFDMDNKENNFKDNKDFHVHVFSEKKDGDATEYKFLKLCKTKELKYIQSTKKQDYYEHFDVILFPSQKDWDAQEGVFVDIKGKKSLRRNGPKQTKYFFVELHKEGWIYNSKADYIAMDVSDDSESNKIEKTRFLIYNKKKLIEYMEKNIRTDLPRVSWPEQSLLRVYIRKYKMRGLYGGDSEKICATVLSLLPTIETFYESGTFLFEM